jgi:23S rRNA-intervening sequence protein
MQKEEGDLAVRTKNFALQIIRLFPKLPRTAEAQVLGKQLLRSGTSVGANYREAYRGRSKPEFIAKCGDSLRELEEWSVPGGRDIDGQIRAGSGRADRRAANQTTYWLELLVDGKIVPADKLSIVRQECDELIAIFVTILESSKDS